MDRPGAHDVLSYRDRSSFSSRRPISLPDLQVASKGSDDEISQTQRGTPHAAAEPTFLLAWQQTIQSVNRDLVMKHPAAAELSPVCSSTHYEAHGAISRSPSLNSERRVTLPVKASLEGSVSRAASLREHASASRRSSLATLHEHDRSSEQTPAVKSLQSAQPPASLTALPRKQATKRHSSLRHQTRPSEVNLDVPPLPFHTLGHAVSDSQLSPGKVRPRSHPP